MPAVLTLLPGSTEEDEGPQGSPRTPRCRGALDTPSPDPWQPCSSTAGTGFVCLSVCLPAPSLFVINKELQTPGNANLQLAEATISLPGS